MSAGCLTDSCLFLLSSCRKSIHETCKSIFGYVVFRDPDSVVKALGLYVLTAYKFFVLFLMPGFKIVQKHEFHSLFSFRSTTKIGDNYISVQRVGNTTFENDVTVFIGNLPLKVQENAVREFFDECGHIQGIRLIRDSTTGIGKGFGFVSFGTRDGVILALEKNGADFEGREMRVKKAGKETEKREKRARKVDSKNARRRLRDSDSKGGKKSQSPADTNEDPDGGDEAEEGGGEEPVHRKKQKVRKTDTRIMFSGERMGKSVTKKKKKKQKLLKGRQSAGKKQAIARLLTA